MTKGQGMLREPEFLTFWSAAVSEDFMLPAALLILFQFLIEDSSRRREICARIKSFQNGSSGRTLWCWGMLCRERGYGGGRSGWMVG